MASKKEQHSPNKKKFTSPLGNQKYVKGVFPKFKANLRDFGKPTKHGKRGHFDLMQRKRLHDHQKNSPIRYQLGGDSTDPLNLNSLIDRDPAFVTPQGSPSPLQTHEDSPIPILEPRDVTDPLNLKCIPAEDGKEGGVVTPSKRKKKKRKRHGNAMDAEDDAEGGKRSNKDLSDERKKKNRKKQCAENHDEGVGKGKEVCGKKAEQTEKMAEHGRTQLPGKSIDCSAKESKAAVTLVHDIGAETNQKHENSEVGSTKSSESSCKSTNEKLPSGNGKKTGKLFIYGNYNRYYGYRNNQGMEDTRLKIFKPSWFHGKDVLDIGCNVGHLTLAIARDFSPHLIMGIDIDTSLIHAARNNLRYYDKMTLPAQLKGSSFPISFALTKGPLAPPIMPGTLEGEVVFPHNVVFKQENYVPADERSLERQGPMYDTILCLSLTKWVHLNWGDRGLKMMFQKMFKNLRPGGCLVLEPQPFASYKKKKNLTEKIRANYDAITLRPEHFIDYLLSSEVGFVSYEALEIPTHKSAGFRRPLYLLTKATKSP